MAENDFEKTEAPTPRRMQEARQDGNVARSTDLTAALMLLASVVLIYYAGSHLLAGLIRAMQVYLTASMAEGQNPTRPTDIVALAHFAISILSRSLVPVLLGIVGIGLLATVMQVGFLLTAKPMELNITKLSPLKGLKNMVNLRAGVRLSMSLTKIAIIATVAIVAIVDDMPAILHIGLLGPIQGMAMGGELAFILALKLVAVLLILGILDYSYQRWQRMEDLRMSKQDIKEEMKRMEGDPLVKQRRARVARQLAMQRTAAAVPNADVIVTNPTHFSVALKYDSQDMRAPKVIAKGADYMAMRIRQIAMTHSIPIVERKPLARALYHNVEVGQEIPSEHYAAVAEILAYVYRLGEGEKQTA